MPSDSDRFRPHDHEAVAERTAQAPASRPSAFGAEYGTAPASAPQQQAPRYAPPLRSAPDAPPQSSAPRYTSPHYAAGFDGRDAPLIHPAAAQASSITPYGVPVYRTPVYAAPVQPARGLSITALVLGLCSVVFAWIFVVVPIIGIVFGILGARREPAGRTMAIIGLVASAVGLLWVLLVYLLPLAAFFSAMVFTAAI